MFQVLIRRGKVMTEQVPAPVVSPGAVLIRTAYSCISAGTEISSVQGSAKPLIQKALEQPEKVRKIFKMALDVGLARTWEKVQEKLDSPSPTGYSLSGTVLAVGAGITDLQPGDRVAAAGAGLAHHAEFVDVPRNLLVKLPKDLDFPSASTVALGSIAMQGVRRLNPTLGEFVVVLGVGIAGQLALQMLKASGARVAAVDLDPARLDLAQSLGADITLQANAVDAVQTLLNWTGGHGADAVLFCAATENPQALKQAFQMTRKKGRVVMLGVWGKEIDRADIYEKEIDFLISTSYGPGRYDEAYEQQNQDYPYSYVRWTENRNMEEYLRLLSEKRVNAIPLIQATYPVAEAAKAFEALQNPAQRPVVVLIQYQLDSVLSTTVRNVSPSIQPVSQKMIRVGLIGAGEFASGVHLPNLKRKKEQFALLAVSNRTGHTAKAIADQYAASYATSDYREILSDPDIDLVMICTRHRSHGALVLESLKAGKHVFVEKPLCLERQELQAIESFYSSATDGSKLPLLMVGYNRRFSPYVREIHRITSQRQNPLFIHYRMNAGHLPLSHWVHSEEGGGRIRGEACHLIDLFTYLTGSRLKKIHAAALNPTNASISSRDNLAITFTYADGSLAVLEYFSTGSNAYPKEFMEVHFDQKTIVLDDYRSLRGFGVSFKNISTRSSNKGHFEELEALYQALREPNRPWPIALWDMVQTTEATLQIEAGEVDPIA